MAERPVLTTAEWAWIAGLLEGEGSFMLNEGHLPRVTINMTDFDIIRRMHGLLRVGNLYENDRSKWGSKDTLTLDIRVARDALWVMDCVEPWMGERRTARIREVRAAWEANPTLPRFGRTHCKHGHEYTEENTAWVRSRGKPARRCRTCARDTLRRHRAVR